MSTSGSVLSESVEQVAVVRLNRPDKLNAMNYEMGYELRRLVDEIREDHTLRALVVTGAGKLLCGGPDHVFSFHPTALLLAGYGAALCIPGCGVQREAHSGHRHGLFGEYHQDADLVPG